MIKASIRKHCSIFKRFKIEQRSLPSTHPSLIRTNINLASTLEKLNRHDEVLEHAQRAVEIARHRSHPKLKIYENYLNECEAVRVRVTV
jgi:hypothetical protein